MLCTTTWAMRSVNQIFGMILIVSQAEFVMRPLDGA
jgi:hypothetical protein